MTNIMIIAYSIFIPVFLFISGFAKAVMDLSEEGKIKFKPSRYWIKSMSSPNKWKDGDPRKGEKFFGSSRWFVSLTDAWHLFGFIMRVTFGISFIIVGYLAGAVSLYYLFGALINYIVFIGIFLIFHTYKILKK